MNEVRKTRVESLGGAPVYASPRVKVVQFSPEGVLCTSNITMHDSFDEGSSFDI